MRKKLLIVIAPAINATFLSELRSGLGANYIYKVFKPPFCALTLPVQASLYTGALPYQTGIVANGIYLDKTKTISFWNQSFNLIDMPSFWDNKSIKVALIFMQLSLASRADIIITPKPLHLHHGGMIDYCYTKPQSLWDDLVKLYGPFKLKWYWGPFVSIKSSKWIKNATVHILKNYSPDIAFAYIPHMDYISQKIGYKDSFTTSKELKNIATIFKELLSLSDVLGYDCIIFSDSGADFAKTVYYPNKILKQHRFLKTYKVKKYEYIDLYESDAFTLCDHQIAYIYCNKSQIESQIYKIFKEIYPSCDIYNKDELRELGIYHKNMGDIALFARGGWFSYKWWEQDEEGPDYKRHIDIHRKEGYDPLELFWEPWKFSIAQNDNLIKMSMGNGFTQESKGIFVAKLTYNYDYFQQRNEVETTDIVSYIISQIN